MLTLSGTKDFKVAEAEVAGEKIKELLKKEWLLTNNRGGYVSSTVTGCNSRRYHGLLIGSLNPPVNRVVSLSTLGETLSIEGKSYDISTFEFNGHFSPCGFENIKRFYLDSGAHFEYEIEGIKFSKSIYLDPDRDRVFVEYDLTEVPENSEFILRPFVSLRDFHYLQRSDAELRLKHESNGLLIDYPYDDSCQLFLKCEGMKFEENIDWWYNFTYRIDHERGQSFKEDIWTPGFYRNKLSGNDKILMGASLKLQYDGEDINRDEFEKVKNKLSKRQGQLLSCGKASDDIHKKLVLAADQFVTECGTEDSHRTTILAGFPWFADWGRDAFISLPGLLLSTGRYNEAKSVLTTFANAIDEGMVPNRFDDRSDTAHFNSIDASLWYINAAFEYLKVTGDRETFENKILRKLELIIKSYRNGTRFGIQSDDDGLISGGSEETQLTWMDAKFDGVVFTPRYGKAVEVNALWYNAVCLMGEYFAERDIDKANYYHQLADKSEVSFCEKFWNEDKGYLNDCILPDGEVDSSLRPNQVFAVSLAFSPLSLRRQKSIVEHIEKKLLTPFGLRSLNPEDQRYIGRYEGGQYERDEAYHQGTVWAYLMGAFIEAYLKVNPENKKAKKKAKKFLAPLLEHISNDACLGSISEVFDGDMPQEPRACFAQAWSVAEVLRSYLMIR